VTKEAEHQRPGLLAGAVAGLGLDGEAPQRAMIFPQRGHDGKVLLLRWPREEMVVLAKDDEAGHLRGTGLIDLERDARTHRHPAPDSRGLIGSENGREAGAVRVAV